MLIALASQTGNVMRNTKKNEMAGKMKKGRKRPRNSTARVARASWSSC